MKKLSAVLLMSFCMNLHAQDSSVVTVKEIKAHLATINPDTTCMDEYLKRRTQLITKVSLSPLLVIGGSVASTYVGGVTAAAIAGSAGDGGWAQLGYAIGGAGLGLVAGVAVTGADTTAAALTLNNINTILKALAEQHMNLETIKGDKLYAKYVKRAKSDISEEEFTKKLMEADASGALCNGSMVKQPKIKVGNKLKFKVAKLKDIVAKLVPKE